MFAFASIAIALTVIFILLLGAIFVDARTGKPLSECVTVKRRKFTPAHVIFTGKTIIPVPDNWTLAVRNENGGGVVRVTQPLYNSIGEGEIIRVSGTYGRITRRWYLKKAHKDT